MVWEKNKKLKNCSTSSYSQHPHNADDGGVDWQRCIHLDLLQCDAHDREQDYGKIKLVPSASTLKHTVKILLPATSVI